jgi:hypothetical protein
MQTLLWQIVAAPQKQQSALETHAVRHTALMHACPIEQSAFARHCGRGRLSAWHMPSLHRSSGPQSASLVHAPKQVPFMQILPDGAQSRL